MNPDDIEKLYELLNQYVTACAQCGEQKNIIYETPDDEPLCYSCSKPVLEAIGFASVEAHDNDPDQQPSTDNSAEAKPALQELVTEVTPAEYRGRTDPTVIEWKYDGINWDAVDDSEIVGDEHVLTPGGQTDVPNTAFATDFSAVQAYFDPAVIEPNVVHLTDERAYVYEVVAEEASEQELASEILFTLADLFQNGIIEGLQPKEAVAPPADALHDNLEMHEDIETFNIERRGDEMVCRIVLYEDRQSEHLLETVRTVAGLMYPKPDSVEVVDQLDS